MIHLPSTFKTSSPTFRPSEQARAQACLISGKDIAFGTELRESGEVIPSLTADAALLCVPTGWCKAPDGSVSYARADLLWIRPTILRIDLWWAKQGSGGKAVYYAEYQEDTRTWRPLPPEADKVRNAQLQPHIRAQLRADPPRCELTSDLELA